MVFTKQVNQTSQYFLIGVIFSYFPSFSAPVHCRLGCSTASDFTFTFFVAKAGKIILFYKDQHRQIMLRFGVWSVIMVSDQEDPDGPSVQDFTSLILESLHCLLENLAQGNHHLQDSLMSTFLGIGPTE